MNYCSTQHPPFGPPLSSSSWSTTNPVWLGRAGAGGMRSGRCSFSEVRRPAASESPPDTRAGRTMTVVPALPVLLLLLLLLLLLPVLRDCAIFFARLLRDPPYVLVPIQSLLPFVELLGERSPRAVEIFTSSSVPAAIVVASDRCCIRFAKGEIVFVATGDTGRRLFMLASSSADSVGDSNARAVEI